MSSLARYKQSTNPDHPCPDFATMAERELSAFFNAITQLFGSQQAQISAEDWLRELIEIDGLPRSIRELRLITAKASTRLASRVRLNASSPSSSPSSRFTETQIA